MEQTMTFTNALNELASRARIDFKKAFGRRPDHIVMNKNDWVRSRTEIFGDAPWDHNGYIQDMEIILSNDIMEGTVTVGINYE